MCIISRIKCVGANIFSRPLWQRRIPAYPLYWPGNPQLRVFLPLFWMKMIKSPTNLPKDTVAFETHLQMTKFDVKNYLEKIYNVSVLSVNSHVLRGKVRRHPTRGYDIQPGLDKRVAWVQLAEGDAIEFPDFFKDKATADQKNTNDYKQLVAEVEKERRKNWSRQDLPQWFR